MIVALKHPPDIVADRPSSMRDLLLNSYFLTIEIADRPSFAKLAFGGLLELVADAGELLTKWMHGDARH